MSTNHVLEYAPSPANSVATCRPNTPQPQRYLPPVQHVAPDILPLILRGYFGHHYLRRAAQYFNVPKQTLFNYVRSDPGHRRRVPLTLLLALPRDITPGLASIRAHSAYRHERLKILIDEAATRAEFELRRALALRNALIAHATRNASEEQASLIRQLQHEIAHTEAPRKNRRYRVKPKPARVLNPALLLLPAPSEVLPPGSPITKK